MEGCRTTNCTVAVTGKCFLNQDPSSCSERFRDDEIEVVAPPLPAQKPALTPHSVKLADLPVPADKAKLKPGLELGLDDVRRLASARPCHLIGILGEPDAGKTALLVSLYLKISKGQMKDVRFANSDSLLAFELLARGARRWVEGKIPTQLTAHTKLEDPRSPGFLHLRVRRRDDESAIDLLFPDLPGEWTEQLIDANEADRLSFLSAAQAIWLMVDGRQLADPDRRKNPIGRLKHTLGRLPAIVRPETPLFIVVTRRDTAGKIDTTVLDTVVAKAEASGLSKPTIVEVASFSENLTEIDPAYGIEDLLALSTAQQELPPNQTITRGITSSTRFVLKYRG